MSGLIPIFMNPAIADPIQFCAVIGVPAGADEDAGIVIADGEEDANPAVGVNDEPGSADVALEGPTASAGTAASRASRPGTALSTCAKSSGLRSASAMVKSTPAAPDACSGVEPSSFARPLTKSGLALAAAKSASVCRASKLVCPCAAVADESTPTIAHAVIYEIR